MTRLPRLFLGSFLLLACPSVRPDEPGRVTIYNGIRWGWENHPTPEPASLLLCGAGAFGLLGYGWLRRKANGST